jgi:hypothetical protein
MLANSFTPQIIYFLEKLTPLRLALLKGKKKIA